MILFMKKDLLSTDQCGSVDWASFCKVKGHWFDSQSGHTPGLQVQSPLGACMRKQPINVSLPPFLPLFPSF